MEYIRNHQLVQPVVVQVPSRVSLAGNPSDLLGQAEELAAKEGRKIKISADGIVVSMPVWSLSACVALLPSTKCEIVAPRSSFDDLVEYLKTLKARGIGDWEHIADQTVLVLGKILESAGKSVQSVPMSIYLDTNIPRQRGLSGSSGMITALLTSLLQIHQVPLSMVEKARQVLAVENALGVSAGLQDRVLQSACVADPGIMALKMDFSSEIRDTEGCNFISIKNRRTSFESALVLSDQPSHSGKIHEPIINRLINGDSKLIGQFNELGQIGEAAYKSFKDEDWNQLGNLMTQTAEMRIKIYGRETLGKVNMLLIEACEAAGLDYNFTGSGGAVVVMLPQGDGDYFRLEDEVAKRGNFTVYRI